MYIITFYSDISIYWIFIFSTKKDLLGHVSTVASNILFFLFNFEVVIIGNQDLTDRIIGQSFHIDTWGLCTINVTSRTLSEYVCQYLSQTLVFDIHYFTSCCFLYHNARYYWEISFTLSTSFCWIRNYNVDDYNYPTHDYKFLYFLQLIFHQ